MSRLPDSLTGEVHVIKFLLHFRSHAVGFKTVRLAHGVRGGESIAEGIGARFRELDSLDNRRDGNNEVSLLRKKLKEVLRLLVADEKNFPTEILLESVEEFVQPDLVGVRLFGGGLADQHWAPRPWETPASGACAADC